MNDPDAASLLTVADALGVHHTTALRDLRATGASAPVAEPERVAGRLAVSPQTVRRWIRQGDLRALKLGGRRNATVRVPEDALDDLTATSDVSAPSPPISWIGPATAAAALRSSTRSTEGRTT